MMQMVCINYSVGKCFSRKRTHESFDGVDHILTDKTSGWSIHLPILMQVEQTHCWEDCSKYVTGQPLRGLFALSSQEGLLSDSWCSYWLFTTFRVCWIEWNYASVQNFMSSGMLLDFGSCLREAICTNCTILDMD
jgi:hypothetical protein